MLVVDIAAGHGHGLAATPNGSLFSWGAGYAGQLGVGERGNLSHPVQVEALSDERVWQVSAGELHSLCVCLSGRVYHFGEVVGEEKDNLLPALVCGIGARIARVVAVNQRSVALTETGEVFVIGGDLDSFAKVPLQRVQQVAAVEQNLVVATEDGIRVFDECFEEIEQSKEATSLFIEKEMLPCHAHEV